MKAEFGSKGLRCGRTFAALFAILILAAGCGDDSADSSAAASPPPPPPPGGGSISIGGTPPSQILQGVQFSFTPTVNNPGGVTLTFTTSNLPSWASINSSTGQITGTPGPSHLGVYSNIRVTVSGGGQSVTSPAYSITVVGAAAGSATLSWQAPTTRTDGSPLGGSLAGYRIYYGQSQGNLSQSVTVNSAGMLTYVIDNLTPATWYFATTAYDNNGLESAYSNIASKTIL